MKGYAGADVRLFKWKMTLNDGARVVAVICSWHRFTVQLVVFGETNHFFRMKHQNCFEELRKTTTNHTHTHPQKTTFN